MVNVYIFSLFLQVWSNLQSETHPFAPLASTMHDHRWERIRSRKFAADLSVEGVLEVVEYTWFEDDSCIISVTRTAYSAPRKNRVSLYLFYTAQTSSERSFSSPDFTMLADDCTACNACSSEICVCSDAVAPFHTSHSNCFILPYTNPEDNTQMDAHFYVHTWQHRYRMITRGSKRGLLTIMFNPFNTPHSRQQLTLRQEFISNFHDQHSISNRIEQQITKLLSKLPQMQTSLSATPQPSSFRTAPPSRHSQPSLPPPQIGQSSAPCTNNSNSEIPSTRAHSLCDPSTSHSSGCNASARLASPIEPPRQILSIGTSTDGLWLPGQSADGICNPHAAGQTKSSKVAVSQITNPTNCELDPFTPPPLCAPEKMGSNCPCSSEDAPSESLSFLLNARGDLVETGVMTSDTASVGDTVLQTPVPTAPVRAGLVGKLAKGDKENIGRGRSIIGNIDSNSSGDSTACDPLSYRSVASRSSSGFAGDGSPLHGSYGMCGEPALKRPRTESSVKSDTLSFSLTPGSWPTPLSSDIKEKELPLPSWSLGSLPDRPLSALGRALGPGRSPSPFGLVGRLLRTPSPTPCTPTSRYEMNGSKNSSQNADLSPALETLPPLRELCDSGSKGDSRNVATTTANVMVEESGLGEGTRMGPSDDDSRGMESRGSGSGSLQANELELRELGSKEGLGDGANEKVNDQGGLDTRLSSGEMGEGDIDGTKTNDEGGDNGLCCEVCGITFAKRGNKMRHILTVHNRLKQFECDQCGAKFGLKADLGRHRFRIHESRSFTCESCGKSFAEESQLEFHIRITHEEDARPWECKVCHIRFGRKSSLTRHEQTVHQHTRFICRVCKKSYSQRFDAIRHERKVHGLHDKGGGVPLKK